MKRSMIKAASVASSSLARAQCLFADGSDSSLYAYAVLRAAQDALVDAQKELKVEANEEFLELVNQEPLLKEFGVLDQTGVKVATVTRYSPRSTWKYSAETEKLALSLKTAQAREQENGTAKKLPGTSDTVFALSLI